MNELNALQQTGLALPSPAWLVGSLLFSVLGFAAWRYGKRTERRQTRWLGIALMFFPYAVTRTWLLYVVGALLCLGVWLDRG